jgi:hypothetical protein
MSPRVPFVVLVAAAVSGAVVAGSAGGEGSTSDPAPAEPGVQMPAAPSSDVLASTWYCAAGTAEEGGIADHTVVIVNPGDEAVTGTVSVYAGSVAASSPPGGADAAEVAPSDDAAGSDDSAAGQEEDGRRVDSATAEQAEDTEETGDASVGDAWTGGGAQSGESGDQADEAAAGQEVRVEPSGRAEVRLADLHQAPLASALVELDGPAVVEHEVAGPQGRDLGPCASSPSTDWYLAWGATSRDARELLVLFNPFPSVAAVDIAFSTEDGVREPVRYQGLPVPAGGVIGLDIGDEVTRREQVSTSVRSRSGPVVVERLQSFDGSDGVEGLSVALAAPAPLESWVFAHGELGSGRTERIVLYNPGDERAEVDVAVRPAGVEQDGADPPPQPFGVTVPPRRYEVVDYAGDDRVPRDLDHVTVVSSRNGVPVVAERVLTFNRRSSGDVAAGTGSAFAAESWTFATLGGGDRPASRLVAYNPGSRPARLSVTGLVGGREVAPDGLGGVEVPAGGQTQIELPGEVQGADASLVVESDAPVVVERLVATAGGLYQAASPGLPDIDTAVPL